MSRRSERQTAKAMNIFVHFVNTSNGIAFGDDHIPARSTNTWSGNYSYTRTVTVPTGLALGNYKIVLGFFDPVTGQRLQTKLGAGVSQDGELRYQIGTLSVQNGVQPITVLASGPTAVTARRGTSFNLTYNFSGGPSAKAMNVFVHFVNSSNAIVFGNDHVSPIATNAWSGGNYSYTRAIAIPAGVAAGAYRIKLGFFDPATGQRITLLPGPGVSADGEIRYQVGTVNVQP